MPEGPLKEGLDIDADVYPYTAFSTILGPLLPEVDRICAELLDSLPDRCIAAGVPARIKKSSISEAEFREYWDAVEG